VTDRPLAIAQLARGHPAAATTALHQGDGIADIGPPALQQIRSRLMDRSPPPRRPASRSISSLSSVSMHRHPAVDPSPADSAWSTGARGLAGPTNLPRCCAMLVARRARLDRRSGAPIRLARQLFAMTAPDTMCRRCQARSDRRLAWSSLTLCFRGVAATAAGHPRCRRHIMLEPAWIRVEPTARMVRMRAVHSDRLTQCCSSSTLSTSAISCHARKVLSCPPHSS